MSGQHGRYPLWLVLCGWLATLFLGSGILAIGYSPWSLGNVAGIFSELVVKAAIAAVPFVAISVGVVFLLNRRSRGIAGYVLLLVVLQPLFGFATSLVHLYIAVAGPSGYTTYAGSFIIEENGYMIPIAVYCLTGWTVFPAMFVLRRKRSDRKRSEGLIDN